MGWDEAPPSLEISGADWTTSPPIDSSKPKHWYEKAPVDALREAFGKDTPEITAYESFKNIPGSIPQNMAEGDRVRSQGLAQLLGRSNQQFNDLTGQDTYGPRFPEEPLPEEHRVIGSLISGSSMSLAGSGGNPIKQVVGMGRGVPGKLMASAINSEGFTPEMGQRLVDQGIRGSRTGMIRQMGQELPKVEQGIQQVVTDAPKVVDLSGLPDAISQSAKSYPGQGLGYQTRSGVTGIGLQPQVNRVANLTEEARALGPSLSSPEALDHMRLLGKLGYAEGEELKGAIGSAARAGRSSVREALTEAHPELDAALRTQQALIEGQRGLENQGVKAFLEDFLKGRMKFGKLVPTAALKSYGAAATNSTLKAAENASSLYPGLEPFLKNRSLKDPQ